MVKLVNLVDRADALPPACEPVPLRSNVKRSSKAVPPVVKKLLINANWTPGVLVGYISSGVVLNIAALAGVATAKPKLTASANAFSFVRILFHLLNVLPTKKSTLHVVSYSVDLCSINMVNRAVECWRMRRTAVKPCVITANWKSGRSGWAQIEPRITELCIFANVSFRGE